MFSATTIPSNSISWEIIHISNRLLQAQQRSILRRRTTITPQQASNVPRYYRLLIETHRPSIMVPVLRRGTSSHRLNNNRIFAVTPQGGLFSGHGGLQQASRRLPHQFVTALTIRRLLRRMSQNAPATMSAYGRIRATCLPQPPPAQNSLAPTLPPLNNTMVVNERVRSQEPVPSEEFATDQSGRDLTLYQPAGKSHSMRRWL